MKQNSPVLIMFSVCLFLLVSGCILQPIEPVNEKVKIVPHTSSTDEFLSRTSITGEFLSCFEQASSFSRKQLLRKKNERKKIFLRTKSREDRVSLACLCVAEGSTSSLQYGLELLTGLQEKDTVEDPELSGLVGLVGRILAAKKNLSQQRRSQKESNERIVSLEEKLEKMKNIEKIISDREKEAQGQIN
ncbi:MAG: hypothetical protein U9R66_06810 [Thermodesulfobacteriota bacterium]|nr:hypothetical protein [Thermodesulfobacteriota bacterium]